MNYLKMLLLILVCSSCSTIGDAFRTAAVHKEMAKTIDQTPYEMSLADLQGKIVAFMGETGMNGKWIYTDSSSSNFRHDEEIKDRMEEGFTYKDKFYTSIWEVDMTLFSGDMEKIKKSIFKSSYHVVENNEKGFVIVKGGTIYEGQFVTPKQSSLKVYKLKRLITPITVNIDWWNLARGKGLFPTFEKLPVDLAASRKYEQEDMVGKLSIFFYIDREKADKLEAELLIKERQKEDKKG